MSTCKAEAVCPRALSTRQLGQQLGRVFEARTGIWPHSVGDVLEFLSTLHDPESRPRRPELGGTLSIPSGEVKAGASTPLRV